MRGLRSVPVIHGRICTIEEPSRDRAFVQPIPKGPLMLTRQCLIASCNLIFPVDGSHKFNNSGTFIFIACPDQRMAEEDLAEKEFF